jgi:hypothetical protein
VDSAENDLASLNLGNTDSRDGYLAEVSKLSMLSKLQFDHLPNNSPVHPAACGPSSKAVSYACPAVLPAPLLLSCYCRQIGKVLMQPSKVSKYMGMDVTSLMSVPLFIMEPFSMLQKMAEIMEYTQLLDDADKAEDQFER